MSYRFAGSLGAGSERNWFGSAAEPNQFHPETVRKLSANLYDIYSEKLLIMDRRTDRNM